MGASLMDQYLHVMANGPPPPKCSDADKQRLQDLLERVAKEYRESGKTARN